MGIDLHDATLIGLELSWETGTLSLRLVLPLASRKEATLVAKGLRSLNVSRRHPWGESASINDVRIQQTSGAYVEVEMQSGDTISFEANEVALS